MTVGPADPLLLDENRVERFYTGGALLEAFRGRTRAADSNRPEDWLGSVTTAWRPPGSPPTDEGLSRVTLDGRVNTLRELLTAEPDYLAGPGFLAALRDAGETVATTGLLVKLLDSAVRLPVHCHPTRDFARRHLGSFFGKTEAWIVLATRQVAGEEPPNVRLGFRRDVGRDELRRWIEERDSGALIEAMHRRDVAAGDTWLVPAGLPHAIGAGVFLVELQEPTDFSIVAETAGFPIAMENAHLGLGWDVMIDAFDRRALTGDEIAALGVRAQHEAPDETGLTPLLPTASARFFRAYRAQLEGDWSVPFGSTFAVGIVEAGSAEIRGLTKTLVVARGATFALPARASGLPATIRGAPTGARILFCLPPTPDELRLEGRSATAGPQRR